MTVPRGPAVAALLESFASAGVKAEPHAGAPDRAVVLPHGSHVEDLPGFKEGAFSIQDPATLEAVLLLDVRPGMRVLDAAPPGGKSVQIGLRLDGRGTLISMDCWRDRMPSLEENLRRFAGRRRPRELGDARRIPLSEISRVRPDPSDAVQQHGRATAPRGRALALAERLTARTRSPDPGELRRHARAGGRLFRHAAWSP